MEPADCAFKECPRGAIIPGGEEDSWEFLASVNAAATNTGSVTGVEVVQVYVSLPSSDAADQALYQLRGFEKTYLNASESAMVSFDLTRRDLSACDVLV